MDTSTLESRLDVSVIIPTRNRSTLLATALRSALRQEEVDLEVIVVDEASSDDTAAVLKAIDDPRLRVLRHDEPRGLSAARNHGADEARGEWLAFLDDDDVWAPDKLRQQLRAAVREDRDWVYTGSVNLDGFRITNISPPPSVEEAVATLPHYPVIPGGGSNVIVRRTTFLEVGPFDTRLRRGGEDWEMWIRLAKHGPPAAVCSPLMAKRIHSSNMFLDIEQIVRATHLIESLHHTRMDWGRMHRWLAERYLRAGMRRAALGEFARAAVRGQLVGVLSDLALLLRRRAGRGLRRPAGPTSFARDSSVAIAAAWLREFQEVVD